MSCLGTKRLIRKLVIGKFTEFEFQALLLTNYDHICLPESYFLQSTFVENKETSVTRMYVLVIITVYVHNRNINNYNDSSY